LFVFGSARLCDGLMQRGLFDEYRICLAPVVLGGGVPLFKPAPEPKRMILLETRALETGAILLRYAPGPVGPVQRPADR
jgi:dihydrofolate reductase